MKHFRLLFVINSPIVGGAELHTVLLSQTMTHYGFESLVFSMKRGSFESLRGQHVLRPSEPKSLFARIIDLRSVLMEYEPDIVIGVNELPLLAAFVASRNLKRPPALVSVYHTTVPRILRKNILKRFYYIFFNRSDLVIFVSKNQRSYWLGRGMRPRRYVVIRNGVDLQTFSPAVRSRQREAIRVQLGIAPDVFTICHTGMMRPEKNQLHTLRAFALVRKAVGPAKLIFVGDGEMRTEVERLADELKLTSDLVFVGLQTDVRPYLAAADVSVVSGKSETLSLSALESMAMGIPVAMGNVSGGSEIVDEKNGRLFKVGDLEALAGALIDLARPGVAETAGKAARRTVEADFDVETMILEYAFTFSGLVEGRAGCERLE